MMSYKEFRLGLFKEESSASLGLFRILIGAVLFSQTFWFIKSDFVKVNIFDPVLHFKYYYFQFLEPLSEFSMKALMFLMLISTFLITIGKYFKVATLFYGLSFTYLWLLDKSYFNNHYYFISLLMLLLLFSNADTWGTYKKNVKSTTIPYWQIWIIKFQIFIIFFIAGINKINTYWLIDLQPMKHILETKALANDYDWLSVNFLFVLFSWLGLFFDLTIGFLIWNRKTRKFAILFYILFNLVNFWLFYDIGEIGFFPFLLIACLTIFFDPKKIESKLSRLNAKQTTLKKKKESPNKNSIKKGVLFCLTGYILLQLLLPFRHLLYNDYVDWTGKGQRFAWRMKIAYKNPDIQFYLVREDTGEKLGVNIGNFLNHKQYTNLVYYPDFIPVVAKHIKKEGIKRGLKNPKVTADFKIEFMGHQQQYLVDPTTDLSLVEYHPFQNSSWILPLKN